jgi:hypothetical protein
LRSGLVFSNVVTGSADDPIEVAWQKVEAAWDEDDVHRRFVALCESQGALAEAGRRYRAIRDTDPTRSAAAKKRIDYVLSAALRSMEITRTTPAAGKSVVRTVSVLVTLGVVALALMALLHGISR